MNFREAKLGVVISQNSGEISRCFISRNFVSTLFAIKFSRALIFRDFQTPSLDEIVSINHWNGLKYQSSTEHIRNLNIFPMTFFPRLFFSFMTFPYDNTPGIVETRS
jgi:hypothetical protein